jgi:N-sulfoglucosamine sulfohydrolase
MALALRESGYRTLLCGGWKTNGTPAWAGYETRTAFGPDSEKVADAFDDPVIAGSVSAGGSREGSDDDSDNHNPFFAHFSFNHCHRPFGQEFDPGIAEKVVVPATLPDTPTVRKDIATLCQNVKELDEGVGRILDAIDRRGLTENTAVIFITDHGAALAMAKHTLYDPGLRTALIMRYPGVFEAGIRRSELLSNLDFYPTLLELAGIDPPAGPSPGREDEETEYSEMAIHGRSFLPLLKTESESRTAGYVPRKTVIASFTYGQRSGMQYYTPKRSIRTEKYKLIRNYTEDPTYLDGGWVGRQAFEREVIENWPRFGTPSPKFELYDLESDPWETENLADKPDFEKVRDELSVDLEYVLRETGDEIHTSEDCTVGNKKASPVIQQWVRPENSDGYVMKYDYFIETKERPFTEGKT